MSSSYWQMGGYAVFVWGSYGIALAVFAWNLIAPRLRRREILKELSDTE